MRATLLIGLVAWGGCSSILGIGDLTIVTDGAPGELGMTCFGNTSLFHACPPRLDGSTELSTNINTDSDMRCQTQGQSFGPQVCMIAGSDVSVTMDVQVT